MSLELNFRIFEKQLQDASEQIQLAYKKLKNVSKQSQNNLKNQNALDQLGLFKKTSESRNIFRMLQNNF